MFQKTIKIGNKIVGDGYPCYIIAEAGVNHNGKIDLARKLIEIAAEKQADAVKFQKRTIKDILIKSALEKPYLSETSLAPTYGEHREALELSEDNYRELYYLAQTKGLHFLASGWDKKSIDFLDELGVPAFKMASADLTNLPLLEHAAKKNKPIILSTGMSNMEEIEEAVETIGRFNDQLIILHCVSTYPCENVNINLRVMELLKKKFDCPVGYSGHERGVAISIAARALGAVIIERHFTIDRAMKGPDHAASLEPQGLEKIVNYTRTVEAALGRPEKFILEQERPVRDKLAKSIAARVFIPKGAVIAGEMLAIKGPGTGLMPKHISGLVGKVALCDIAEDTLVPNEAINWFPQV